MQNVKMRLLIFPAFFLFFRKLAGDADFAVRVSTFEKLVAAIFLPIESIAFACRRKLH
ncbi:MAG TPA: hypothetical protein VEQ34_12455 [Pyrinomonadaceae bacterium]|nr:hypothetical protein [Pyrinomonadaceae bacterium]